MPQTANPITEAQMAEQYAAFMSEQRQIVDEHGFAVLVVQGQQRADDVVHSVGMGSHGLPDILVTGVLPPAITAQFIETLLIQWGNDGVQLGMNDTLIMGKDGKRLSLCLVAVPATAELSMQTAAIDAYYAQFPEEQRRAESTPAYVQLIWPDAAGRFPEDPHYDTEEWPQALLAAPVEQVH